MSKHQICFEEKAVWIPFVLASLIFSLCVTIFNFLEQLFPWIQVLIVITTFFLSKGYIKTIVITIDGEFENQITIWGIMIAKRKIKSKKTIIYIEIFDMGGPNGMPNGRLGYLLGLTIENNRKKIFKLYDRRKVLQIIKFLKENDYAVKGWSWDY